ncbi:unnamed protein product [Lupinus luteus]|uniref:DUF4005 domain-containing protein n=1 Tax=Lupinus luteus TaxID=3873 RepID=A0AAV1Y2S5_LUPLU
MGKRGTWLRNFFTRGKNKDKKKSLTNLSVSNVTEKPTIPISTTTKEKKRWSFRRSSATASKDSNGTFTSIEEAAAIRIQSVFRSYLARKALCALRGLVKLQALVRGHLVRKQAMETLRCMQALVIAQTRARAQRVRMVSESKPNQNQSIYRKSIENDSFKHMYNEMDIGLEENIKIVEMDVCETKGNSRSRNTSANHELSEHRIATYYSQNASYSNEENYKSSPSPSALTDLSPRRCNAHFDECSFPRPLYAESMAYDYPLYPNYMANTESSRAKLRSHSAPKQRPESYDRQPSRRRTSVEGRNVPRPVRMQRSSSHVGVTAQNYQYPWSIKLDKSTVSLKDSECGSTSTMLTNSFCI